MIRFPSKRFRDFGNTRWIAAFRDVNPMTPNSVAEAPRCTVSKRQFLMRDCRWRSVFGFCQRVYTSGWPHFSTTRAKRAVFTLSNSTGWLVRQTPPENYGKEDQTTVA